MWLFAHIVAIGCLRNSFTHKNMQKKDSLEDGEQDDICPSCYYVATCETCDGVLVYYDFGRQFSKEDFTSADLVWPEKKTLHKAVPKHICQIYEEAAMIHEASLMHLLLRLDVLLKHSAAIVVLKNVTSILL